MSAYIVNDKTIDILVTAFISTYNIEFRSSDFDYEPYSFQTLSTKQIANKIGQSLVNQNYASVNYRYKSKTQPHKYTYTPAETNNAILLHEINTYDYQACETPDYYSTALFFSLCHLKDVMLKQYIRLDDKIDDISKKLVAY